MKSLAGDRLSKTVKIFKAEGSVRDPDWKLYKAENTKKKKYRLRGRSSETAKAHRG
eukprot:TRINITY_DN10236_c0_g2_i1.p4 TRINITY_DN10236_c0_g2~~TRINITY_DN10236_c0_g2_i1.p4  ORF type:complete len:56 (-),score=38.34 TRINITY_DN10236_c0_g2_i1:2-169(-)